MAKIPLNLRSWTVLEEADIPIPDSSGRHRATRWLFWFVLGAAAVAALVLIPWKDAWAALAHARKIWIMAAFAICLAASPVAATQWWLFVPRRFRLSWGRTFEITALTAAARAALPFLG